MQAKVYHYVFDTMSDWETLITELNSGRYFKKGLTPLEVITVGIDKNPVTTMGGIKILPRISIFIKLTNQNISSN